MTKMNMCLPYLGSKQFLLQYFPILRLVGNWQCQLEDYNPSLTPNNFTFYTNTHTQTPLRLFYQQTKEEKKSNPSLITNFVRSWQSIISIVYGWWIHILELFHFMSVIYFHIFRLVDIRNNKIITLPSKKMIITLL